ncbi:hypothetical protein [Gelidibacter mesophilus]|uniref:hypothetical protein n=1 Tax=Gelidibacter mesophilus TaxID=169050 RepID=UPI000424AAEE|nr:hypothetical protein [Gelidibacter mesophilus]
MEKRNDAIIQRLDRLIELQEDILKLLSNQHQKTTKNYTPTKENPKTPTPDPDDLKQWFVERYKLKEQFNLVAAPQFHVYMKYKNTRDDSVFDRFKKQT